MKQFAIGLTVFVLILTITICLAMIGYYHLKTRSASSEVPVGGSAAPQMSVAVDSVLPISSALSVSSSTVSISPSSSERDSSSESMQQSVPLVEKEKPIQSSEASVTPPEDITAIDEDDQWRLMLVNQTHLLPEDYTFDKAIVEGSFTFDARAAEALIQMLSDGRAAGHSLRVVSTFRTVERSEYLYTNKIAEYQAIGYSAADAAVEAGRWIAPPRTSEHNAGLAIDVVSSDYDQVYGDLMHEFENFPSFEWLSQNCAEYGFVLRYPKDKQEITGITYEPWHYRYVGVEHARKMQELGMCLEEYVEWLEEQGEE